MNGELEQLYELEPIAPGLDDVVLCWPRFNYYPIAVINKKRHCSRKWKKKRGLLKRQRKAAWKRFSKTINKITKAAREVAKAVTRCGEVFRDMTEAFIADTNKGEKNER